MRQYLDIVWDTYKVTNNDYALSIGTKIDDFGWPMFSKFRVISQIWETTTAKRMNIDPHIVSDRIVAHKCTFQRCIDHVDVVGRSSAIQCHHERVVKTDDNKKLVIFDNWVGNSARKGQVEFWENYNWRYPAVKEFLRHV